MTVHRHLTMLAALSLLAGCGVPTIEEATSSLQQTIVDCTDDDGCAPRGVPIAVLVRPSVDVTVHQLDGVVERVTLSLMDRGASLCPIPAEAAAQINGVALPFDTIGGTQPCPSALWLLREHEALATNSEPTTGAIDDGATTIAFEFRSFTDALSMSAEQSTAAPGEEVAFDIVGERPEVLDVSTFAVDANENNWSDLSLSITDDGTVFVRLPLGMSAGEAVIVTELQVEAGPESCTSSAEGQAATCYGLLRAESHHPITIE